MATSSRSDLAPVPPGPPLVIVLSSVSGAGKDSVRDLLIAWGLPWHFVVTATTRPPRADEVDGMSYHFLSEAEFHRLLAEDGFVEHAIVYGRKYGVPRSEVERPLSEGRDVLARIDVQGAATLRRLYPDSCLLIWLAAPTPEEAERRLGARDTEDEAQARLRRETAAHEIEEAAGFDYVVVNETGRLESTCRHVVEIVAEEKRRRAAAATD